MARLSPILVALLCAGALPARTAAAEEPAGVLTRAPAVVAPAEPEYPPEAKAQGRTGTVTLELEISASGEVTDAVVTGPAGHGFDEAALAAARKLRFSPAEIDGKPSAVRIEYRFDFVLREAPPPAVAAPPPPNLRGRVLERGTRLPIAAALVQAGGRSTYTDREGRFALTVPVGEVKVSVSDAAHARFEATESVYVDQLTEVTYWLRRTALAENETVVTGKKERREVSHQAIAAGEIRRIAGVSGDTVKVVQNLPGVARPPFGSGQLVVRGGNPRDTRVYVDGVQVPAIFHFGGLTSIYSSELVKEVEFQAGNFGVTSGRAIGGRVNLVTRDPGDRTHALADLNLYQGTALWEGRPGDDLGLAVAVRRSYVDAILSSAPEQEDGPGVSVAPRFYDLQAKAAWKLGAADTLRFDLFGSDDQMVLTDVDAGQLSRFDELKFGNTFFKGNLRHEHRFSEESRLLLAAGGGWQEVTARVGDLFTETDRIWSTTWRAELRQRIAPWLEIVAGGDAEWHPRAEVSVTAGTLNAPGQVGNDTNDQLTPNRFHVTRSGYEAGVFAEAAIQPVRWLRLVPGVRADVHHSLRTLSWVDPRFAARVELGANTAVKGGVGLYHQAPPLAYLTEEWGNPALREEGAWQYSVGLERKLGAHLSLDVELYAKRLFRLAIPSAALIERDGQEVPEKFRSAGSGTAYGAELLLRYDPDGRYFGWIAYSLSRTRRDQSSSGDTLQEEGSAYDQPHNLVAVGTVELPELWEGLSAGFRLRFTSGNPYERYRTAVYDADTDQYQPISTGRLDSRAPPFFQLDLRVDKKWTFPLWSLSTYLEVQNATNRQNPEFPAYNFDYSKQDWVSGVGFFPAFGVRAEY
ncbi:MAG TPA: TonB family protein [Anaeromyxobacter sp.]|nr:TonB family protein [Anaeromyxobacter sp.]